MLEQNIGNSVFSGLNDNNGIFICGYEWGWSKSDEHNRKNGELKKCDDNLEFTFSNRAIKHGEQVLKSRYDSRIIRWFKLWGHPLSREGLGGKFEKCIMLTNWCNTQNNKIEGNCYKKIIQPDQVENFIFHIHKFKPKLIIFFGSKLIYALQKSEVMAKFQEIMGDITSPLDQPPKNDFDGKKFYISFQSFEKCDVVCMPHPSSSRGLKDDYIKLFSSELDERIKKVKLLKKIT